MTGQITPTDLRYVDPRSDRQRADTRDAATRSVRARLGDAGDDILDMLGLQVQS